MSRPVRQSDSSRPAVAQPHAAGSGRSSDTEPLSGWHSALAIFSVLVFSAGSVLYLFDVDMPQWIHLVDCSFCVVLVLAMVLVNIHKAKG